MIVLKIGGSALSDKRTGESYVDEVSERVARELGRVPCIIVHGVGYTGHTLAKNHALHLGLRDNAVAWAHLRVEVKKITRVIVERLVEHGIPAVELSPADLMRARDGKILNFELSAVEEFVRRGFVPVMHADGALDEAQGISVISGDTIATELAIRLGAKKIIYGTDVDGIYDISGNVIPEIDDVSSLSLWDVGDFSGGMKKKVEEALRLRDVEVQIINLRKDGILSAALAGRPVGTVIRR